MIWIAGWIGLLAAAGLLVTRRRDPTWIGGRPFLRFNAGFAAVALALPLLSSRVLALPHLAFWSIVVLASWTVRSWSLVVGLRRPDVLEAIEGCLARVRLAAESSPQGFRIGGTGRAAISLRDLPGRCVLVRFHGRHRKLDLARSLLAKRFRGVVPRLRVQTR